MSRQEDELANTVSSSEASNTSPGARDSIGAKLGRYAVERELGAGGMGIVYAAFDPDLERNVALKVLRGGIPDEFEQRLLREARAMARLTHPNVITVYEVGSVDGRDYVAMELIDGASLAVWLREQPRSTTEVIAAFVDAGRGLAAAHTAGMVHRDFKPHNVLRSRAGRIAVTDFGLAREATDPMAATTPVEDDRPASRNTPTSLSSGLTGTGSVLGTPAYMAPEQWTGGMLTPATDQFAFCVALWEGLAGERPFSGNTLEALQQQVTAGPTTLNASAKLPRWLRAILVRGLDPDPRKRWPSMDVLLAKLVRVDRRLAIGLALGVIALATTSVLIVIGTRDEPIVAVATQRPCEAAAIEPDAVWSAANAEMIRAKVPQAAKLFDTAIDEWRGERTKACREPDAIRRHRLACLDRVLVRIDAIRRAKLLDLQPNIDGIAATIYSPDVCQRDAPPKLPDRYSDAAIVGLALRQGAQLSDTVIANARASVTTDPCAAAYLGIFDSARGSLQVARDAKIAAQLCGDEQAYAATTANVVIKQTMPFLAPTIATAVHEAELAVAHAAHPILTSNLRLLRAQLAQQTDRIDEALAHYQAAYAGFQSLNAKLVVTYFVMHMLLERGWHTDLARIGAELPTWRAAATLESGPGGVPNWIEWVDATARWERGEVGPAHDRLLELLRRTPPRSPTRKLTGTVLDERGQPVPDATVAVAPSMIGDAMGIAVPFYPNSIDIQLTTTDLGGRFTFENAPDETGVVVAQRGNQRSLAVLARDGHRLILHATSSVDGRITVEPGERGDLSVVVRSASRDAPAGYEIEAPVLPDGTFHLDGVMRGAVKIGVLRNSGGDRMRQRWSTIQVGATPLTGLQLAAPSNRSLIVLVRSSSTAPLDAAYVYLVEGTQMRKTIGELAPPDQLTQEISKPIIEQPTAAVAARLRRNDLLATMSGAPIGPAMLCVSGIQVDAADEMFLAKLARQKGTFTLTCQPVPTDATIVVLEVPPMKRLD